jgi:hypothetical protein
MPNSKPEEFKLGHYPKRAIAEYLFNIMFFVLRF